MTTEEAVKHAADLASAEDVHRVLSSMSAHPTIEEVSALLFTVWQGGRAYGLREARIIYGDEA
jgi:hypothetical protein